ncbi:MAG: hypothetical protein KDB25_06545 [Leucobacter sp.]|nr:hypothetical protein [Leucobacter sp.]
MPNRRFAIIALVICAGLVAAGIAFGGPAATSIWAFLVPESATPGSATPAASTPPPSQAPSKPAPSPEPATEPEPTDPCAGLRRVGDPPPEDGIERIFGKSLPGEKGYVAGYAIPELRDLGPAEYASGKVVLNERGDPQAYVVAAGDTLYGISERFCIGNVSYLGWVNAVRRNGAWAWDSNKQEGEFEIYPGDTLNLDAHTITSIGDEQGVVYAHTPEFYIPPQR